MDSVQISEKKKPVGLRRRILVNRKLITFLAAIAIFTVIFVSLPDSFGWSARVMIAIVSAGVALWALEPIPLAHTALLILLLMLVFKPVEMDVVFSGFSSPAVFLIIGGMMMARAVNDTPLADRVTYLILSRWGGDAKGLLASIFLVPQIQSFFIPAAAVRTTLLLPIAEKVIDTIGDKTSSSLRQMIMIGVAFAGTISGTPVLTAAIGNILTVEILNRLANINVTYFEWFLYTFPLWLALVPTVWFILLKLYPLNESESSFPEVKKEMTGKLEEFGPLNNQEKRCMIILLLTVGLWVTEPLHGLHPSVPALIGVLLMTLPGIGCSSWRNVVKINFETVLLLGTTLSMGYGLMESGAARMAGEALSMEWVLSLLQSPLLGVVFILIVTQIFHLAISNVSTAVVTLVPVFIGLSQTAGADPLLVSLSVSLACLHGYILVVESMPNILVHSTGQVSQREFLFPGFIVTLVMIGLTILMAMTWWKWIGLL